MQENDFPLGFFFHSEVDPVTSQIISRQIGLIKKSFKCEIAVFQTIFRIWKLTAIVDTLLKLKLLEMLSTDNNIIVVTCIKQNTVTNHH